MGNKLGRRRQVVDEKYTNPQGLYQIHNVDLKKLRKLILERKIAPCHPGDEESGSDLEECPICFLYYPSLNRSRCCMKSICTECFLQMGNSNSTRPTQCPFCKTYYYAVEYRGVKTEKEKGMEQTEEQRVIEAKIRMRQREFLDEERIKRQQPSFSNQAGEAVDSDGGSVAVLSSQPPGEAGEIISVHNSLAAPVIRNPPNTELNRDDDLDLEEKMVAEAIWQSIQEKERWRNQHSGDVIPHNQFVDLASGDQSVNGSLSPVTTSLARSSPSVSGGLAHAVTAAIAERQQNSRESSARQHWCPSSFSVLPGCGRFYNTVEQETKYYPHADSSADVSSDNRMVLAMDGHWNGGNDPEGSEAGTSYASYHVTEDAGEVEYNFPSVPEPLVPQSFDEQMMLAMTVSLAEGRAMSSMAGVTWQ